MVSTRKAMLCNAFKTTQGGGHCTKVVFYMLKYGSSSDKGFAGLNYFKLKLYISNIS